MLSTQSGFTLDKEAACESSLIAFSIQTQAFSALFRYLRESECKPKWLRYK